MYIYSWYDWLKFPTSLTTVPLPIYGLFFWDLSEEPAFLQNFICLVRRLIYSMTTALVASTSQCIFYVPISWSCLLQMSLSATEEAPSPQTTTFYFLIHMIPVRRIIGDVTSSFLSFYEAKYVTSSYPMITDLGYYCATSQVPSKSTLDLASQGAFCF